ncbi:uracil phosphoribosyltransferase [Clostridium sp. DL-VIII]|uniref:uracil phosphoribosyltransferase n=1 Tax=Clostridium sp. DL-VIII TaxID=641107 RepID=UPI00023AF81A|nr:uracil phosphoribosyltransferase [Clostridium sp. DL-VIII]EHI97448.1 uracil phosphoribosyltransferase [Clostridium sp. DL-VIII]
MSKVTEINHPLILHKLAILRDEETGSKEFRKLVEEISMLMAYEVTRDLHTEEVDVKTPVAVAKCQMLAGKKIAVVPILRAGLGMVDGVINLIPAAKVGHIGLYRDEKTLQPVEYFCKLPQDIAERDIIVVDPMLATGGSSIDAITMLKNRGAKNLKLMCLVGAPEGIEAVQKAHTDVDIYLASIDEKLNESGYIVPGLGDAGDRLFGTK